MDIYLKILTGLLTFVLVVPLYRAFTGPTVFDRLLGAGLVGTKTVVFILLIGLIYDRIEMFIDISLAYAILNFIGSIAIAQYFGRRRTSASSASLPPTTH